MDIIVTKDDIKIKEQDTLHKGEYNVNELNFTFSDDYNGLPKMAIFSTLLKTYETAITDNACIIPAEALATKGELKLGVYAYTIDDEVITKRYSPTPVIIRVNDGSYVPNASNPQQENPTAFEEFMQQIEGDMDSKQAVIDDNNKISSDYVDDTDKTNKFIKTLTGDIDLYNLGTGLYYIKAPARFIDYAGTYHTPVDTVLFACRYTYRVEYYFLTSKIIPRSEYKCTGFCNGRSK